MTVCILNMVIAGSLVCLAKLIDTQYTNCTSPEIIVYTRTTSILLDGLTKFLAAVVTLVVSIYVVIKKKGLNNKVHTVPSTSAVSTVSNLVAEKERLTKTRRIDSKPNMFYRVESEVVQKKRESEPGPSHRGPKPAWLPIIGNTVPSHVVTFHENETPSTAEQQFTVLKETEFYLMLRNTTTMSILTILQLLSFLPYVILSMVYHNCSMARGHCENFILLYRMFTPLRVLCMLVQSGVVIQRLRCND